MPSYHPWDLPPLHTNMPLQSSASTDLIHSRKDCLSSHNIFVEKHQSLLARMDHPYEFRYDDTVQVGPYVQPGVKTDQHDRGEVGRGPAIRTSPPTRWAGPSRPREFGAFIAWNPHISPLQRTQSTGPGYRRDAPAPGLDVTRPKRRPRPLDQERLREPSNLSMLYPQMNPYGQPDEVITHTSFDYYPRSVSQPVTPRLIVTETATEDAHIAGLATQEPLADHIHGDAVFATSEAAFNDEHEFRLFVEATAGLGPIPSMDDDVFTPEALISQPIDIRASHSVDVISPVSPVAETPNTLQAMQHFAQMPQSTLSSPSERPHLQSFGSDFDDWLYSPPRRPRLAQQHSMPQMSGYGPLESWEDVPDSASIEDELPDYAASQAQAQAAQRVEATRRAQELQRRWQESGSHVIRYG
jgi:hypothetical protein